MSAISKRRNTSCSNYCRQAAITQVQRPVLLSKATSHRARVQELEGQLRDEKEARQIDSKRANELSAVASQLRKVKIELEQESTVLKADKVQLLQRTEALVQQQAELRQSSDVLMKENTTLTQQASIAQSKAQLFVPSACKSSYLVSACR